MACENFSKFGSQGSLSESGAMLTSSKYEGLVLDNVLRSGEIWARVPKNSAPAAVDEALNPDFRIRPAVSRPCSATANFSRSQESLVRAFSKFVAGLAPINCRSCNCAGFNICAGLIALVGKVGCECGHWNPLTTKKSEKQSWGSCQDFGNTVLRMHHRLNAEVPCRR